jgi:hypothetical protein
LRKPLGSLADGWLAVHAVQCQHRLLRAGRCRDRHPPTPPRHATELINNGVSIEADAVLGLTARIQRFGGYATDEVALAPEPFDAATTGPDLRYRSGPRACPHWARLRKWSAVAAKLSCCRIADDRRPGKFFKEIRRRCRIGAVVFVVRVRPPTRGGAN